MKQIERIGLEPERKASHTTRKPQMKTHIYCVRDRFPLDHQPDLDLDDIAAKPFRNIERNQKITK